MSEREYIIKELSKAIDLSKYKKLYVIAWYEPNGLLGGITSRVSDTYEEISAIYNKEYNYEGKYVYKIVEVNL